MAPPSSVVDKYLLRYAEPRSVEIAERVCSATRRRYSHVLVVPAHRELPRSIERVVAGINLKEGKFLLVVVSNCSVETSVAQRDSHLDCETALRRRHDWLKICEGVYHAQWKNCDCLLMLRSQGALALAAKQGVGLARKIGTDVGVALYQLRRVSSPWLLQTDADVRLPSDYFLRAEKSQGDGSVALVYPFTHNDFEGAGNAILSATLMYEAYLRYVVVGLAHARSPFAYHSLGSTLAVDVEAYVRVRGFPQRQAGEDFHLLNKLLKIGGVCRLGGSPLLIAARSSDRAPFGTGPAVRHILTGKARNWEPAIAFARLRDILAHIRACTRGKSKPEPAKLAPVAGLQTILNDALARGPTPAHAERRVMTWFDGLKTLRLVRQASQPSVPAAEALSGAPFAATPTTALMPHDDLQSLVFSPESVDWSKLSTELEQLEPRGVTDIVAKIPSTCRDEKS